MNETTTVDRVGLVFLFINGTAGGVKGNSSERPGRKADEEEGDGEGEGGEAFR